ncbi:hypothetical protein WCLP8_780004 [uncultured Gammaproteobacteria bacterium]
MGTNPAASLPEADSVRAALAACPFVVVSDGIRDTDTTAFAHVLLPAAAWGEKDGTVTNSERRISRQRAFRPPQGQAKPDWWIVSQVAARLGWGRSFAWTKPAQIFREHAALTRFENNGTRGLDLGPLAELDDHDYDDLSPIQWPVGPDLEGSARLFADGRFNTPDRRARLIAVCHRAPRRQASEDFPLVLNTGRLRDQWHTMTRTGLVPRLAAHTNEPFLAIHPDDAAIDGVKDGELARVTSATGSALLRVRLTPDQARGSVFAPIHWNRQFSAAGGVGSLASAETDPLSGQPEMKHTPVNVAPWQPGWRGFLVSRVRLQPQTDYWVRTAAEGCWVYTLAGTELPADLAAWAEALTGPAANLPAANLMEFHDTRRSLHRWVRLEGERLEACLYLDPDGPAVPPSWLVQRFALAEVPAEQRPWLLCDRPPDGGASGGAEARGRIVCACMNVTEQSILTAVADHGLTNADQVGASTEAGTNCGSCRSEITTLIERSQIEANESPRA